MLHSVLPHADGYLRNVCPVPDLHSRADICPTQIVYYWSVELQTKHVSILVWIRDTCRQRHLIVNQAYTTEKVSHRTSLIEQATTHATRQTWPLTTHWPVWVAVPSHNLHLQLVYARLGFNKIPFIPEWMYVHTPPLAPFRIHTRSVCTFHQLALTSGPCVNNQNRLYQKQTKQVKRVVQRK